MAKIAKTADRKKVMDTTKSTDCGQQLFVLIHSARKNIDEVFDALVPAARRF